MSDDKIIERCPIEVAISLLCKKWRIQVIRDIFFGKTHFNEFKESNPKVSNKVLSNCLKELEEDEIIKKTVSENNIEYSLTEMGESLNKVLYELALFTLNNEISNVYFDEERKEELKIVFKEQLL